MYRFLFYLILALVVFMIGRYSTEKQEHIIIQTVHDTITDTVMEQIIKHDTIVKWVNRWKYDTIQAESVIIVQADTNKVRTCENTVLLKWNRLKVYTNSEIYTFRLKNRYPELMININKSVHVRERKPLPKLILRAYAVRNWNKTLDIDAEAEIQYRQVFIAVSTRQIRVGLKKEF